MKADIILADDTQKWRNILEKIPRVDVCQLPEYHLAYATRTKNSKPVLWVYEQGENIFAYPFLLTPVEIPASDGTFISTPYYDISSIYGYSGPLIKKQNKDFFYKAWEVFDEWSKGQNIVAEFSRFSLYAETKNNAHPDALVEYNRPSAITVIPKDEEELFQNLGPKTRNMIRKAVKSGLEFRKLDAVKSLSSFQDLYNETMQRNNAPGFFFYDDNYYNTLLSLPENELLLFGVYDGNKLVSASMALRHREGALYHLGASLEVYARNGAGNLGMFGVSKELLQSGVKFFHVGGGRTTDNDDPLYRFKRSNATDEMGYYIGKRIVDLEGYRNIAKIWEKQYKYPPDASKLLFYR